MPYLGRNQVPLWNPWDWSTLPEAVYYVVKLDGMEPEEARRQIHFALIDGMFELKWGAFGPPPHLSTMAQEPEMESPPLGGPLWETADIDWEAGTVIDNFDPANGKQERRVLLIWRRSLVNVFDPKARAPVPPPPITPVASKASALGDAQARSEPSRTGRPQSLRGRKPRSGEINDTDLLVEMGHLLVANKAASRHDAAQQVADNAEGNSVDSKTRRLSRKFTRHFGVAQPPGGKTWADALEGKLNTN